MTRTKTEIVSTLIRVVLVFVLFVALFLPVTVIPQQRSLEPSYFKIDFDDDASQLVPASVLVKKSTNSVARAASEIVKPVVGTLKPLVFLVDFPDLRANYTVSTPEFYQELLFGEGNKSLYDFYLENSYGKLKVKGSVFGKWVMAPMNYGYYENNYRGMGFYPNNTQRLVEDIIKIVDREIDFSQYDGNSDGLVDGLFVIYAGQRADTKNPCRIYPHQWSISPVKKDGVVISSYTVIPEYRSVPGDTTIGVFCHEFGHIIGAVDMYDLDGLVYQSYDGKRSYGLGKWSVMAYGTYGTTKLFGDTPSHFDAWHKIKLGWLEPVVVKESVSNIDLKAVEGKDGTVLKIVNPENPCEYFLIEYRKKSGFNSSIPGEGILIYHIDERMDSNNYAWTPGTNSDKHYLVSVVQADGKWDLENCMNLGDKGDVYYSSASFEISNIQYYGAKQSAFTIKNVEVEEGFVKLDLVMQN